MAATKPVNIAATSLAHDVAMAATKPTTTAATKHMAIPSLVCCLRWLPSLQLLGPTKPTATGGSCLAVPSMPMVTTW